MIKLREDSNIEIWAGNYVNNVDVRVEADKNKKIIQIEPGCTDGYIVEVVDG